MDAPSKPPFIAASAVMRRALSAAHAIVARREGVLVHGGRGTGKRTLAHSMAAAWEAEGAVTVVDGSAPRRAVIAAIEALADFRHPVQRGRLPLLVERVDLLDEDVADRLRKRLWYGAVMTGDALPVRLILTSRRGSVSLREACPAVGELLVRGTRSDLRVPPLRRRGIDLPLLARSIVRQACEQQGIERVLVAADCIALLREYEWPGNVTELEEVLGWAILEAEQQGARAITAEHLPLRLRRSAGEGTSENGSDLVVDESATALDDAEAQSVLAAYELHEGRRAAMANELGMSETTLRRRLKELGLLRRYRRRVSGPRSGT